MEKYYFIVDLVVYSIIPTLLVLYFTERVKGSVKKSFDRKLEEVKKENSIEIANFQTELNSLKAKENFKFTKLHEKRFEVLQKTYEYLNQNEKYLLAFLSPYYTLKTEAQIDTIENLKIKYGDEYFINNNDFGQFIDGNLIFFDKDIENLLIEFRVKCNVIFMENSKVKLKEINEISNDDRLKHFNECFKKVNQMVTPIRLDIKNKFRELLGE